MKRITVAQLSERMSTYHASTTSNLERLVKHVNAQADRIQQLEAQVAELSGKPAEAKPTVRSREAMRPSQIRSWILANVNTKNKDAAIARCKALGIRIYSDLKLKWDNKAARFVAR